LSQKLLPDAMLFFYSRDKQVATSMHNQTNWPPEIPSSIFFK
jgi:hypothetical protein